MMRLLVVLLVGALASQPDVSPQPPPVTYEAFALRFGILPAFPVSALVAGADRSRTIDIPVMVWLLKGSNGRQVLIDSGFYRQKFEKHVPIAQTPDAASNLKAQDRIKMLASDPRLIVPRHDPGVFTRFPSTGDGQVAIR